MNTCTTCGHPQREEIDRLLSLPGSNLSQIAGVFGLNRASLQRHRAAHSNRPVAVLENLPPAASDNPHFPEDPAPVDTPVPRPVVELRPSLEIVPSTSPSRLVRREAPEGGLLKFYEAATDRLADLDADALAILEDAKTNKNPRVALLAIRESAKLATVKLEYRELLARSNGELADRAPGVVNIILSFGGSPAQSGPALPAGQVIDVEPSE